MGVTESKLALVRLSAACSTAEKNGRNDIEDVLSDKQFIKCLASLWKRLPERSKKQIVPGFRRTRQATKTLQGQKITLSKETKSNIDLWGKSPSSFLGATPQEEFSTQKPCPVSELYGALSKIEIRSSGDIIRLRFLKVLFHHLKDRCCAVYLRQDAVDWMTARVVAAGLYDDDNDEISSKIKSWTYIGGKYDALCRDIGTKNVEQEFAYLSNLFFLPEDISDRFILKELPVKGDDRKRVIDSLMRRGIRELDQIATMDDLAHRVFSFLWNKVESSIGPNESEMIGVSAYLKDTRHLQGARIIRLQDGECGSPRRSDEMDSPCDTDQSSIAGETSQTDPMDTDHCQNAHATRQAHGPSIQPSNTNLAANIRQTDASRVQSNELPNQRSVPLSEERPTRAFHGQIDEPGVINATVCCPNLARDAQLSPDSRLSESFNPLNFPNLVLDAQVPPDSQVSESFNPLNFPNLVPGAQLPQGSHVSDAFNPLNFPNLVPDAQVPPDSQVSDAFNPLNFPNLIPDTQVPTDSRHSESFNHLNFPNLVLDVQLPQGSQISDAFNTLSFPNIALPSHGISVPQ
ncbi:hypothetical protein N7492_009821 [Penicillium capsulatum]|uniref:Uncharacterized protein n=1 Tax=Penicillium capsulatum TaxID=69766 RepID=A0A9W9LEB2_9EURO|nr:hypothetical protein N7492_009821 [Penicillium capsulatum]KAJ6114097.1 hypothetical protein N7512_007542 [Penicillium capsulatum]